MFLLFLNPLDPSKNILHFPNEACNLSLMKDKVEFMFAVTALC